MLRDSVERSNEYEIAMKKIDPILDKEFPEDQVIMGTCHRYWARKKELLKKEGIEWRTPAEMNPTIRFD